ncbi:MAG: sulfatase-like hydrolase/transferase [Planctomycetes bacterium]|nr:sulfatase-like hydrolase/transferase [Planctomycetota bacterium]
MRLLPVRLSPVSLLVVVALVGRTSGQVPERPPNVVLILADDLGAECLSCYGSTSYATPHLDRLAAAGIRFTRAHAQPLCTPTRVELLTGLCNVRNYEAFSVLPRGSHTFAHGLGAVGYCTGVFGKWQLLGAEHYPENVRGHGCRPDEAGFRTWRLWQLDRLGSRYWGPTITSGEAAGESLVEVLGEEVYGPDEFTTALLDFVAEGPSQPFLAFYPMALVHDPFEPPPGSADRDAPRGPRHFAAMVAYMDRLVGRIVDRIDELGLGERTVIVFVGDNGTHPSIRSQVGDRTVRGGKQGTSHYATHVPLVVRWSGTVEPGQVRDELVHVRDLCATLLDVAGAEVPDDVRADSWSLAPLLRHGPAEFRPRETIPFWYHPRPIARPRSQPVTFAIDGRFKLYGDGRIYDDVADPEERHPLDAEVPEAVIARLRAALASLPARR